MTTAISEKARFRSEARARRRAFVASLDDERRAELQAALAANALPLLDGATVVASYAPMGGEIDPAALADALHRSGRSIVLPWFQSRTAAMRFRRAGILEPGPFGTLQPVASEPLMTPDAVLAPLVAADRRCDRLGQGEGHFDRCLAGLREGGLKIAVGLAWDAQVVDVLPVDSWDQRLDAVATPSRVIRP